MRLPVRRETGVAAEKIRRPDPTKHDVVHRHPVEIGAEARGWEGRAPSRDVGALLDLQRQVGNRAACGLMALGQPKLEVGPARDPYEVEADAVARQVVAVLRDANRPPATPAGGDEPVLLANDGRDQAEMTSPTIGRRAEVGAAGGTLDPDTETAIHAARTSGGAPLSGATATAMEGAFGADFSQVRVHAGRESTDLNARIQANAFTIGSDIFFRDAIPDVRTSQGQELLAHELTHTIQQGGARAPARRSARVADRDTQPVEPAWHGSCCGEIQGDGSIIRRHSSWEHSLLGDAKTTVLGKIGAWQDLIAQTDKDQAKERGQQRVQVGSVQIQGVAGPIGKGDVMHVLVQEMTRVKDWQVSPPKTASTDDAMNKTETDKKYQVIVVRLPGDGELITYGEMNTLADFYGSYDAMATADPASRHVIVQSVRKETFLRLREVYDKLKASLTTQEKAAPKVLAAKQEFQTQKLGKRRGMEQVSFKGAIKPDYISGLYGQLELIGGLQKTGTTGAVNEYTPTLARNACHFVPESWLAWADYHDKAVGLAQQSRNKWRQANQLEQQVVALQQQVDDMLPRLPDEDSSESEDDPSDKLFNLQADLEAKKEECSDLANQALVTNGFGDHYLQDSYASGHMINKTQIMQWYVEYIDTAKEWDYAKDENWRKAQMMAYGQAGLASAAQYNKTMVKGYDPNQANPTKPRNPQSVENEGGDWKARFSALGLQVPPSLRDPDSDERTVFEWWQKTAAADSSRTTRTGAQLQGFTGLDSSVEDAVANLVKDGVVRTTSLVPGKEDNPQRGRYMRGDDLDELKGAKFNDTKFVLRPAYVPSAAALAKFPKSRPGGRANSGHDDTEYQDMAMAVTYGDFVEFMSSSFIQKATNALHDTFCKGGLSVKTKAGEQAFRVYGDDSMFNETSSQGAAESGKTANMSRDAIVNIIDQGKDGGNTTKKIMDRLPSYVEFYVGDVKKESPLADFHNPANPGLKKFCMDKVFPGMAWNPKQKLFPGGAAGLGTITSVVPHPGEAF